MDAGQTNMVTDFTPVPATLVAGASISVVRDIGQSSIQGMDWDITCASTPVWTITAAPSNGGIAGPFVAWTSAPGTSMTGTFSPTCVLVSGTQYCGGTDLRLFPARYCQLTIHNTGSNSIVFNRLSMFTF